MAEDNESTGNLNAENRLRFLIERARQGDASALPALRKALDASPELWGEVGDLAAAAETAWVELIGGDDLVAKEALPRKLAELKDELAAHSPTPVVKLLVERAAACWLQASYFDAVMAKSGGATIEQVKLYQEQQDRAHKRYLSAISALTTTQRLIRPATTSDVKYAMADISPEAEDTGPSLAVVDVTGVAAESRTASRTPRPEKPGRSA